MKALLVFGCCLALLSGPARAQDGDGFKPPAGCEAFLTVQSKGCLVSHHFLCEGDPEGWQRRVDLGLVGPVYLAATDAESQWMENADLSSGVVERFGEAPRDPASFSVLTSEGTDTYDFRTKSEQQGERRYVGYDSLTGETKVIDGVTLEGTEYRITAYDAAGDTVWESKGRQWIIRDMRLFLSGTSAFVSAEGEFESDQTPVEFAFPGEAGFLSSRPRFGCGETASLRSGAEGDAVLPAAWGAAP